MNETQAIPVHTVHLPLPLEDKWQRERRAFLHLLPELLKSYRDKFVAIHQEQLVDSDEELIRLCFAFMHGLATCRSIWIWLACVSRCLCIFPIIEFLTIKAHLGDDPLQIQRPTRSTSAICTVPLPTRWARPGTGVTLVFRIKFCIIVGSALGSPGGEH